MIRVARERIDDLFGTAEAEARRGQLALADRCVRLARRIGMRYNVRLLPEYRDLYCRGCSTFWVEGRTVRTRLREGGRTRTCLRCGRLRRTRIRPSADHRAPVDRLEPARQPDVGLAAEPSSDADLEEESEEE